MNETIRIYQPRAIATSSITALVPYKKSLRDKSRLEVLRDVISDGDKKTKVLMEKHSPAVIFYNWLVFISLIALALSLVWWGIQVNTEHKISISTATALADYRAEQEAIEQQAQAAVLAEQNSLEAKKSHDIELMAKFLEGLSGFVKNKGYTNVDLYTYAQCPLNRILNPAFWSETLDEVLRQEGQWVGYSEHNQVTLENKELATKIINDFYNGEARPCSYEYCWAEFTDNGLYLKSDFGPASFNNTWRAKGVN